MVAAERGAQLAIDRLEVWRNQHSAHGETVGYTLGYGDDVGLDVKPLVGKELSAATVSALDFVANENGIVLLAESLQPLGKFLRGQFDAANALNAF